MSGAHGDPVPPGPRGRHGGGPVRRRSPPRSQLVRLLHALQGGRQHPRDRRELITVRTSLLPSRKQAGQVDLRGFRKNG